MNPLFFKTKKNRAIILILSVVITFIFYNFKTKIKEDPFTSLCKNSDAYYIYSYKDVTYAKSFVDYKRYYSIDSKMVINTSKGVENYAFLDLNETEAKRLINIDVKTRKANGSVIQLDSSEVFSNYSRKGNIHYPIPSVEPGDTIEIKYVFSEYLKKHELLSFANLYSNIPSKNSQYSINTKEKVNILYKCYNGFSKPQIFSNDSIMYLNFSTNNIKPVTETEYSCLPCELPYIYYTIEDLDATQRTWKDVYNEEFNFLTQPIALDYQNSLYYNRWKSRVLKKVKDSSKYYKLKLLNEEILKNFSIDIMHKNEIIKSNGYFLKQKRFDPISIRRFYRQILEDLDIEYWAVFARSKNLGKIDVDFIRKEEYDHVFFAYRDNNKKVRFLYPHEITHMYCIDELPTSIYNTSAVMIKPVRKQKIKRRDKFISSNFKLAEVDSVSMSTTFLPGMNSNLNFVSQTIFSDVNLEEKKATYKSRLKISGGLSTELRTFIEAVNKDDELEKFYNTLNDYNEDINALEMDSISNTYLSYKKPFAYQITSKGSLNNVLKFINDSIISISFDKLIQHNQIKANLEKSELNYYLDYSYSDNLMIFINFPKNIETLGIKKSSLNYNNKIGKYSFSIKQNKKNQLHISSNYKIKEETILKHNIKYLDSINEYIDKALSKRIIIKIKKN